MPKRKSDEQVFCKNSRRIRRDLLPGLLRSGMKEICVKCGLGTEWNGEPITLQIDHEDGDKTNNEMSNLRFLCPNCHSQCPTSFNRSSRKIDYDFTCLDCPKKINSKAKRCKACHLTHLKSPGATPRKEPNYLFPPIEEIIQLVQKHGGWLAASRELGIGDNTLRKHLRANGVEPKNISYKRRLRGDTK